MAFVAGSASWILDQNEEIESSPEFEKKYEDVLTELSKFVGAACNTGDIEAYQFLIHYTHLIFKGGYEVLKEVYGEVEKSKDFQDFLNKVGIFNQK
jgi:hypothetical protein